jgi:hypothetical protein
VHVAGVKGEHRGKLYSGIVYAALNGKGEVYGTPIKSSKFGKQAGNDAIQKRIEKSKEAIKTNNLKESPKATISKALESCKSRADFEKRLLKNQISVLFRENESGRIYGVTFIDHRQKFVFNGSRLGKDFSANAFEQKFNEEKHNAEQEKSPEFLSPHSNASPDSTIDNLSGLLTFDIRGENPEEEAFIRRMKRKRRRKRKL